MSSLAFAGGGGVINATAASLFVVGCPFAVPEVMRRQGRNFFGNLPPPLRESIDRSSWFSSANTVHACSRSTSTISLGDELGDDDDAATTTHGTMRSLVMFNLMGESIFIGCACSLTKQAWVMSLCDDAQCFSVCLGSRNGATVSLAYNNEKNGILGPLLKGRGDESFCLCRAPNMNKEGEEDFTFTHQQTMIHDQHPSRLI